MSGCSGWDAVPPPEPPAPPAFQVVGNRIEDAEGNQVTLRGVNRSGTEYKCIQNGGFYEGPGSNPEETLAMQAASVAVMKSWNINAVRVPLNESCWLGISGAPEAYSGESYRAEIAHYVALLHEQELIPILELHWAAPGEVPARRLQPMPNRDHSLDFWRSVAETFLDDERVLLEPYNEPFPSGNSDGAGAWDCWKTSGCITDLAVRQGDPAGTYEAVGMQELVDVIRATGARHLLLLGGVQYSNSLSQWLAHRPDDPLNNLAAAWHVYNYNPCADADCWNGAPAAVASQFPVVATEIGQDDCGEVPFVEPLLGFLDEHADGYLAWSWNAFGPCRPAGTMPRGSPWSLVTDYASGAPNGAYARTFHDHLEALR